MRIVQIYPEFQIFYLPDFISSGYGHRHISGSLNFITNIFRILFFCQAILIYEGMKEMFYLTMHSTHVIYVEYMVKDYSDSKRKSPLPPVHGLLFSVSSKGSVAIVCISILCVLYTI